MKTPSRGNFLTEERHETGSAEARVHWAVLLMLVSLACFAQENKSLLPSDSEKSRGAAVSEGEKSGNTDLPSVKTVVTVTATRSEIDVNKAPASTSVVTESEMKARNSTLIDQTLNLLPGVILSRTKGVADSMPAVGMRGFGGAGANQSRVLILLDGEPLNDAYTGQVMWSTLPVSEVQQVEVARGPFSALYGGNAMGGVINVLTRPVEGRHFETDGQFGSNSTGQYSTTFSDRFFNKLGVSVGYQRIQEVGYDSQYITKTATKGNTGTPVTGFLPTFTNTGSPAFVVGDSGHNWWQQDSWRGRAEYSFSNKTTAFFQYIRQQWSYGYGQYVGYGMNSAGAPVTSGAVTFNANGVPYKTTLSPLNFVPAGPEAGPPISIRFMSYMA